MKRLFVLSLVLFLAACSQSPNIHYAPPPTLTAGYIPTLSSLVSSSDVIAVVTVQSVFPDANGPAYDTKVRIDKAVKGSATQLGLAQFDNSHPLVEGDQELLFAYADPVNGFYGDYASPMAERFLVKGGMIAPTWAVPSDFADPSLVSALNGGTCTEAQFLSAIAAA